MKKIYMKPATDIISGITEKPVMLDVSGSIPATDIGAKQHGFGWGSESNESDGNTNAWGDCWDE